MKEANALCIATKKDGKRCTKSTVDGQYCVFHTQLPEYVQKRKQGQSLGGNTPKRPLKLTKNENFKVRGPEDVMRLAGKMLEDVAKGKIALNPSVLKMLPSYMKVYMDASKEVNTKRIEKLEAQLILLQQKK